MPGIGRAVAPGYPHHVIQRGNNRENVFFEKEDRTKYLSLLNKYAFKWNTPIMAYCLMSNRIHLLTKPPSEESLFKMMQRFEIGDGFKFFLKFMPEFAVYLVMGRYARQAITNIPYHIINRGNNRQTIFFCDYDCKYFFKALELVKERYPCRIYSFVLMTNHALC